MVIEHENIIYMSDLPNIGGTSTFVLQMVKRYKDRDIAVVYKSCQYEMVLKVKKYCRVYQLGKDDTINCKVMIINFDSSVCEKVNDEAKVYMVLHADYSNPIYNGGHPKFVERINGYIAITKHIAKWLKEKCDIESEVIYNPLEVEDNKPLILMSATRMSKEKGRDRTIELGNALNKLGINYKWLIFTPSNDKPDNPNIIYMGETMEMDKFMCLADYVVQLSDSEGLSYTINEALYRNIPVIVTPLPYLEEIGFKDGETGYILNFDCSNVNEVAKSIVNKPVFKFKHLQDSYDHILTNAKSTYEKDLNTPVWVKCVYPMGFLDKECEANRVRHEIWKTNKVRAYDIRYSYLSNGQQVQLTEEITDPKEIEILEQLYKISKDKTNWWKAYEHTT